MKSAMSMIDQTALRFNQAAIIGFTISAFVFDLPWLLLFVALVLALGTLNPRLALFKQLYQRVLKPRGWLEANLQPDDPAPHRFAQGLGAVVLLLGSGSLLWFNFTILGWGLAGLVVVLAAINLFFNFCAGCFIYYQLDRRGWWPGSRERVNG